MLPVYGPVAQVAAPQYRCGIVHERGHAIVVTAGLGTSTVPMRLGAPPDLWVLTLGLRRSGRALVDRVLHTPPAIRPSTQQHDEDGRWR